MPALIPDTPIVERAIVEMTNAYRAKNNKGPVRAEPRLTRAARAYARFLARTKQFSHTADGREVGARISEAGYDWCTVGENLALHLDSRGFASRALAKKALEGWINSPSHRKNMLTSHVTEIGVGVVRAPDKDPKYISVQLFARPRSLEYEFQVSNATKQKVTYAFGGKRHTIDPHYAITHRACVPAEIKFQSIGTNQKPKSYKAHDGLLFQLQPDRSKSVNVKVTARTTVTD